MDTHRATLNDLVYDVLKLQLGYGDEFSVTNEVGTLYDLELDDNLPKKFTDLGIKSDSFLTVIDDDDDNPRVNLTLAVSEECVPHDQRAHVLKTDVYRSLPESSKPILIREKLHIARKRRANGVVVLNGHADGAAVLQNSTIKRKRSLEESNNEQDQSTKRGKMDQLEKIDDSLVIVQDHGNGTIIIDDD